MNTSTGLIRYRGSRSNYVVIATRGTDQYLGLSVQYGIHQTGVGSFILRFVAHGAGVDPKQFTRLTYRADAQFVLPPTATTGAEVFEGVRLNKIAVPVFDPAVRPYEIAKFAAKFGVWETLAEWVLAQVQAEGFTPVEGLDLAAEIASPFIPLTTPEDTVKLVVSFPDLTSPEMKKVALKMVEKPIAEPDDDPEEDDEDDDEDDKKSPGWLN